MSNGIAKAPGWLLKPWLRPVHDAGHGGPAWTSPQAQDAVADFLDRVFG